MSQSVGSKSKLSKKPLEAGGKLGYFCRFQSRLTVKRWAVCELHSGITQKTVLFASQIVVSEVTVTLFV